MARNTKFKPSKYSVAIVGEGQTEWFYFTNMREFEKFNFKVEPDLPKHSDYKSIIKRARRKRDEGYDLVFCVLDLERILTNDMERKGYLSPIVRSLYSRWFQPTDLPMKHRMIWFPSVTF